MITRLALATALLLLGCEEDSAYIYYANQYEPGGDCLDGVSGLDFLSGTPPDASCAPTCLVGSNFDSQVLVYVSTMCGPPPPGADVSGSNPLCTKAVAALSRSNYCLDGGGSSNPLPDASGD